MLEKYLEFLHPETAGYHVVMTTTDNNIIFNFLQNDTTVFWCSVENNDNWAYRLAEQLREAGFSATVLVKMDSKGNTTK